MKFNPPKDGGSSLRTQNYEGGEAFRPASPELGLYKLTVNNLLENTYYRRDIDALHELADWFEQCAAENPEFVLQLATYARRELFLRDVPQVLLVLAANHDATKPFVPAYGPRIIARADELCTVTAIQLSLFGKPIPKPLKRAINRAFHQFDEYQLAKYEGASRDVRLQDVMNLTHPRPETPDAAERFERLMRGPLDAYPDVEPLPAPHTWEVVISQEGNTAEAWREVLPDMGVFAVVRNLRNMLGVGLNAEEILTDGLLEQATNSRVYPFRFYQSYQAVQNAGLSTPYVEEWLSAAIDHTASNVPDELGDTFVGVDLSGSMGVRLSSHSSLTYQEISSFFGAVLIRKGADVGAFASYFEPVRAHYRTPTLELAEKIQRARVGGATNGWKVLQYLTGHELTYDRVILLTDMQIWDSSWSDTQETVRHWFEEYRDRVNPDAALYMVDLSSYGDLVTPEGYDGVYNVSGWTSKLVDFIVYAEREDTALAEIHSVEP